jgi:undecaprenyl-diphosphatase
MVKFFKAIDNKGLKYISEKCQNRTFDKMMPIITMMGNLGVIWFVISSLMFLKVEYRIIGIGVILAVALTTIIGEGIIKHIVKRKRPFYGDSDKELLISRPITYSFPSGHTASSFAVAAVFIETDNAASLEIILLASLIAFSRIYLGVHYPSDVIGGGIIGFLCGLLTVMLFLGKLY